MSAKESVKKILSDTGAPPGVSSYWNEWWHDACWYLTKSTCTTSTTVTGCVLDNDDGCRTRPGDACPAVYDADGCADHADFEAVAALDGHDRRRGARQVQGQVRQGTGGGDSGLHPRRHHRRVPEEESQAPGGRGHRRERGQEAHREAGGRGPQPPRARCTTPRPASRTRSARASRRRPPAGKRRRLAAAAYDVEVFFSSAEVDDDKLTKARDALKAEGIEATLDENVDPIEELKTINGVDASAVDQFKTQSTAAAAARRSRRRRRRRRPNPPPPPKLVVDDDRRDAEVGSGKRGVRERVRVPDRRVVRVKSSRASERLRVYIYESSDVNDDFICFSSPRVTPRRELLSCRR